MFHTAVPISRDMVAFLDSSDSQWLGHYLFYCLRCVSSILPDSAVITDLAS